MSIQTDFGAFLLASNTLVTAVPTDERGKPAIYYGWGPQDSAADPYLVYKFPRYSEEQQVGGPASIASAEISISCFSRVPDNANALASVVLTLLRFEPLAFTMGSFIVNQTWIRETRDEVAAELGLFEVVIEVGMDLQIS